MPDDELDSEAEERLRKLLGEDEEGDPLPIAPDPSGHIQHAREQIEAAHEDLHERLAALEAQAKKGQAHYKAAMPKPDKPGGDGSISGEQGRSLGTGLTVAYAIIGTPLVLYGIGYLIDRALGGRTQLWESALAILGCVMGVGYAMFVANKAAKN